MEITCLRRKSDLLFHLSSILSGIFENSVFVSQAYFEVLEDTFEPFCSKVDLSSSFSSGLSINIKLGVLAD